jgi:hypothetical protein
MKKLELNDVHKKYLKIIGYLTFSNGLGYLLATYVAKDPLLTAVFGPTINFLIWALEKELNAEGYVKALKK